MFYINIFAVWDSIEFDWKMKGWNTSCLLSIIIYTSNNSWKHTRLGAELTHTLFKRIAMRPTKKKHANILIPNSLYDGSSKSRALRDESCRTKINKKTWISIPNHHIRPKHRNQTTSYVVRAKPCPFMIWSTSFHLQTTENKSLYNRKQTSNSKLCSNPRDLLHWARVMI